MKIILKKGYNFAISTDFILHLLKETNNQVGNLFFYKQEFTESGIVYHKLDRNHEDLKTVNPNIHFYIMLTTKDFGDSFESNFSYSTIGYTLNSSQKSIFKDKYKNIEYFTSPEKIFYDYIVKDDENWRKNEKLIELIEESLRNRELNQYFHPHKLNVVEIPDDVDWVIVNDDGDGEYIKENIEVREWH